jgi:hypothetical protein
MQIHMSVKSLNISGELLPTLTFVSGANILFSFRKQGRAMSDERKQEALETVSIHNNWFLGHLLNDDETIIIVPRYKLNYRDEYLP